MTNGLLRHYVLDADNHLVKVDFLTWAMWFEENNRHVGYTEITSQITVSTVFVGLDMRFHRDGPPIVFETAVFGGPLDHEGGRYSSWDDADAGHKAMVRRVRQAIGQKVTP